MSSMLGSLLAITVFLACSTFFAANVMAYQAQKSARAAVVVSVR